MSRSPSPGRRVGRDRSVDRSQAKTNEPAKMTTMRLKGLTPRVQRGHLQEILGVYGKLNRVHIPDRHKPKRRAFVDFEEPEQAALAHERMNGAMIDGETVFSEILLNRPPGERRADKNRRNGGGNRRGDRRGRQRDGRGELGGRRREDRARGPQGGRGRRNRRAYSPSRSPPPVSRRYGRNDRFSRSPSPYRSRRGGRNAYSPVRSRSPYERRRGGGGSRFYDRSPPPRYGGGGGYRGSRRYSRSRSVSRGRR
ncbi:hypothetical protein LPJ57_005571 [Coemansia sp. RSA 486]|nr:hypothetical protein LPJ57_005571 [Coemansia sp. RSA 486]